MADSGLSKSPALAGVRVRVPPRALMSYDVDASAVRLANYLHVLRELVHRSCGHLALEPRFEVKALLGDHVYDDARATAKLLRRVTALGGVPGTPSPELAELLDRAARADTHEYLEIAYGELKPTLIAAVTIHLTHIDPLLDEPGLRMLTQLLHRQERHVAELPAGRAQSVIDDLGALPLGAGERPLTVMEPFEHPARDAFTEIAPTDVPDDVPVDPEEQKLFAHALMNAKLLAAEHAARSAHEQPDMPWEAHVDLARHCWDAIRHAEVLDRLMATELGCHWGDYPVDLSVPGPRLHGWRGSQRRTELGQSPLVQVLDYFAADERTSASAS
jgi:hypothetical protein